MIVLNPKAYENDLLTLAEEIREEIIVIELIRCEDGKYFLYHNVRLSQGQLNWSPKAKETFSIPKRLTFYKYSYYFSV